MCPPESFLGSPYRRVRDKAPTRSLQAVLAAGVLSHKSLASSGWAIAANTSRDSVISSFVTQGSHRLEAGRPERWEEPEQHTGDRRHRECCHHRPERHASRKRGQR